MSNRQVFIAPSSKKQASYKSTIVEQIGSPISQVFSIEGLIPISSIQDTLSAEERKKLEEIYPDKIVRMWGARPGLRKVWDLISEGDYILFYSDNYYINTASIVFKTYNEKLADKVWGKYQTGETWSYTFFLKDVREISVHRTEFNNTVGYNEGFWPRGFIRVSNETVRENIVTKVVGDSQPIYLLMRSNSESPREDSEGKEYHYGNTVPNYRSVVTGTEFLLDRRFPDGKKIIAKGNIGTISEEPGSGSSTRTFRAEFSEYRSFTPPLLVTPDIETMLRQLPNYNQQHSIRVLNKDIFDKITNPEAHVWIFQSNPAIYDVKNAVRTLDTGTWLVVQHKNEITPGDRVYLWEAGSEGGIVAVAEIIDLPSIRPFEDEKSPFVKDGTKLEGDRLRVQYKIQKVIDPLLTRQEISSNPKLANLSILKQAQGSNFSVSKDESKILDEMIDNSGHILLDPVLDLLLRKRQIILYGPPGTGKTYNAKIVASRLLGD